MKGTVLIVVLIAFVILLAAAAYLLLARAGGATTPGGSASGPAPVVLSAAFLARTPAGATVTVTVTPGGTDDLREVEITAAAMDSLSLQTTLPVAVGPVPKGKPARVTLQFTGTPPPSGTRLELNLDWKYKYGWFWKGMGSQSTSLVIP